MHDTICEAIENRLMLRLSYNGGQRLIEPHCYGEGNKGHDLLRVFQVDGFSVRGGIPDWRLFIVNKVSDLTLTNIEFDGPRDGYNPDDPAMAEVYCAL